ncbi:MAG: RNA-binding domain-containing protein [Microcystaceae cyanobacterium]
MNELDKILQKLENCLETQTYESIETQQIELKDLSGGDTWNELYRSVCAFLNTEGGIIIIGIKEKSTPDKCYKLTGYNENNESKIKDVCTQFSDFQDSFEKPKLLDLKDFFRYEIRDFLDKRVCIIFVQGLPLQQKYVCWKKKAYERRLTGDHEVSQEQLRARIEEREEWQRSREIQPVSRANLDDLDLDKINEYIQSLNRSERIETLKPDLTSALSFLKRKFFINQEEKPTLLGMLICGRYVEDFIGGRCQVDAYVDIDSSYQVTRNKKILKNNILKLMESSYDFCLQNIQVGIIYAQSGSKDYEYPEHLIRETINNALSHRNYESDQVVLLSIRPNQSISIRNPGNFRQQQLIKIDDTWEGHPLKIRQIIPDPKAPNPKLAEILKMYDKYEGRGTGMSTLTNDCLDNKIDIPYYQLGLESVNLVIPKGAVFDESSQQWLDSFSGYLKRKCNGQDLSLEEKIVLAYFYKTEKLNQLERYTILLTHSNNHFKVINSLVAKGLIQSYENSPQYYTIYLVARELTKVDFSLELRQLFGQDYDYLNNEYQDILNVVFQLNQYSHQGFASANSVANILYFRQQKNVVNIKHYEAFKRKVRNLFKNLEKNQFIVRSSPNERKFYLNQDFAPSLLHYLDKS